METASLHFMMSKQYSGGDMIMKHKIVEKKGNDSIVIVDKLIMHIYENQIVDADGTIVFFAFGNCEVTDGSKSYSTVFRLANIITSIPSEIIRGEGKDVHLVYNKGDIFVNGSTVVDDVTNIEMLFKSITTGSLPESIPLADYLKILKTNIQQNGGLNINDQDLEILLSEIARDSKDPTKPARLRDVNDYVFISFRALVAATDNAIYYEDPLAMMATGISRKGPSVEVPSEKYIKL